MKTKILFSSLIILAFFTNITFSQIPDTQPPIPYITKTECCGQPYWFSYVIDEPRDNPSIRSIIGSIAFNKEQSYNFRFEHNAFTPGIEDSVSFFLDILNPKLDAKAVITFADMAGNDTTIEVNYYAVNLIPDAKNINFGFVAVGSSKSYVLKICNQSKRDFVLDYISLDSTKANTLKLDDFFIELLSKDSVVKQQECLNIRVTFQPEFQGTSFGFIVVADKCNYKEALVYFVGHSYITNIDTRKDDDNQVYFDGKVIEIQANIFKNKEIFEIFDVFGNILKSDNLSNKIDISNFSAGVYFMRYGNLIQKIVIY